MVQYRYDLRPVVIKTSVIVETNMMNIGFSGFAVAFVLICSHVKSSHSYTCYNDTVALNKILLQPDAAGTYHICANTTFNVGRYDSQLGFKDGVPPIIMAHSGIKILCGENGSIEDNCVIRGGDYGIEIINPGFYTPPTYNPTEPASVTGLHVEGFTFTGLTLPIYSYYPLLLQVGLTVKNCEFIVSLRHYFLRLCTICTKISLLYSMFTFLS